MKNLLFAFTLLASACFAADVPAGPDKNGWIFVIHHTDPKYHAEYSVYINTKHVRSGVVDEGDRFVPEKTIFDTPITVRNVHNIKTILTGLSFQCENHTVRIASITYFSLGDDQLKTAPVLSNPMSVKIGPEYPQIEAIVCKMNESAIPKFDHNEEPPVRQST